MPSPHLQFASRPRVTDGTLLLALTGWMDGGLVSTGTVRQLMEDRPATEFAKIEPDPFYILNFPGSMEIAALFRPAARYDDGMLVDLQMPTNVFHCDEANNLVFFLGQEPNLKWQAFADAVFEVIETVGAKRIVFIGSFGGTVPHTREPRLYGSVSHDRLKPLLHEHGVRLSDYEGPSGFSTLLLSQAPARGVDMLSIVAEIPGYLQGLNPLSIEAVTRRLARILNVPVDMDRLRRESNTWELQVSEAVEKDSDLAETVRKLEAKYDNELIGAPSDDDDDEEEHEGEEAADEDEEE